MRLSFFSTANVITFVFNKHDKFYWRRRSVKLIFLTHLLESCFQCFNYLTLHLLHPDLLPHHMTSPGLDLYDNTHTHVRVRNVHEVNIVKRYQTESIFCLPALFRGLSLGRRKRSSICTERPRGVVEMRLSDCCNFYASCVELYIEVEKAQSAASANNLLFYQTKACFCIALLTCTSFSPSLLRQHQFSLLFTFLF